MKEYEIITSVYPHEATRRVNKLIKEGWVVTSSTALSNNNKSSYCIEYIYFLEKEINEGFIFYNKDIKDFAVETEEPKLIVNLSHTDVAKFYAASNKVYLIIDDERLEIGKETDVRFTT